MARGPRRYARTVILGVLALGVLVWSAVQQFGVPLQEVRELFLGTVLGVAAVILLAAAAVLALIGLRRILRGSGESD